MVLRVNGRVGLVEDGSTFFRPGLHGILDETGFVQRIGMDHHLHVVIVGHVEAIVDRGGRRAPILVQLERTSAGIDHLDQRGRARGVALAREAEIDRKRIK
jgi:hypothetical protein